MLIARSERLTRNARLAPATRRSRFHRTHRSRLGTQASDRDGTPHQRRNDMNHGTTRMRGIGFACTARSRFREPDRARRNQDRLFVRRQEVRGLRSLQGLGRHGTLRKSRIRILRDRRRDDVSPDQRCEILRLRRPDDAEAGRRCGGRDRRGQESRSGWRFVPAIRADDQRTRAHVRRVPRADDRRTAHAMGGLRRSHHREHLESDLRQVGRATRAVDRLVDRQSGQQLLLQLRRSDDVLGTRQQQRDVAQASARKQAAGARSTTSPSCRAAEACEGTGYGTAQMRLFEIYRVWKDVHRRRSRRRPMPHLNDTIDLLDRTRPCRRSTASRRSATSPARRCPNSTTTTAESDARRPRAEQRRESASRLVVVAAVQSRSTADRGTASTSRYDLLPAGDARKPPAELIYVRDRHRHVFARTGWDDDAAWLSFMAGPYVESPTRTRTRAASRSSPATGSR